MMYIAEFDESAINKRKKKVVDTFLERYKGREAIFFFEGIKEALKSFRRASPRGVYCSPTQETVFLSEMMKNRLYYSESILVPDLEKIAQNTIEISEFWSNPIGEEKTKREGFSDDTASKQLDPNFSLDLKMLAGTIDEVLNANTRDRLNVFAAYAGKFAKALQELGFDVLASDPCERWVLKNIENGLPTIKAGAEELSYRDGVLAHVAFEPYPLDNRLTGYVAVLKSLAQTGKGQVEFYDLRHNYAKGKRKMFFDLEKKRFKGLPRFKMARTFYGAETLIAKNDYLVTMAIKSNEASSVMARTDLTVLHYLKGRKYFDMDELQSGLGLERKEVQRSIGRIQNSMVIYWAKNYSLENNSFLDCVSPAKIKGLRDDCGI